MEATCKIGRNKLHRCGDFKTVLKVVPVVPLRHENLWTRIGARCKSG